MAFHKPRLSFPRSVSFDAQAHEELAPVHRHDIGVFWDLRRHHLGVEVVTVESIVTALRYRASLLREFCTEWLAVGGLHVLVRVAVVCDLPHVTALQVQTQHDVIMRTFDDLQMQFCNVADSHNPPNARREGICRFVRQFLDDYPSPMLVVVSDDLRLLQCVRDISGQHTIIPIISRYRHGHANDTYTRHLFNRLLAQNIARHPWDAYFYETLMRVMVNQRKYPRNCLQILYNYASNRDTGTLRQPLLAWLLSLLLQLGTVASLQKFNVFPLDA
ncbi:uncharacterized protein LOC129595465 [Paramacrobiotus metropolitanus]|uniref:uncharacterized protein LOC129595465 n=1 Tax=Paramacrobiotus metropolitanus TaxID=2943436 RepID=UPI002446155F|nr:uncharacterized protein LOC129595465 [Paramacrobiotus metropolitanus]